MIFGDFCEAITNPVASIKIYKKCDSNGNFDGYICDTGKDTNIVNLYYCKTVSAFRIEPAVGVCISVALDNVRDE